MREVLRSMPLAKSMREEVVARVLSGLLALDDEAAAGRATDWLEFIAPEEVAALPDEHVAALAGHPLEACQLLAVRILLKRGSPSGAAGIAADGGAFLGARRGAEPGDGAARTSCRMTNWRSGWKRWQPARCRATRSCANVAGPLLKRAAAHDRDAARQLVEQWWPLLFRKEDFEGLHASVYEALTGSFAAELDVIPAGTFRQMLESKYGFGQELGFELLKREVTQPELTDLVEWSVHPLAALREWAREHLDKETLRGDPAHVLKLLEGPYDDSREWAFEFCRTDSRTAIGRRRPWSRCAIPINRRCGPSVASW